MANLIEFFYMAHPDHTLLALLLLDICVGLSAHIPAILLVGSQQEMIIRSIKLVILSIDWPLSHKD